MGYDADAAIAKAKAKKKELEKTPFGVAVGEIAGTAGANMVTKVTPQIVTDTVTRRYGSPTPTVQQVQSQAEAIASHDTDMDVTTFLNQAVSDGVVTSSEAESIFRKTTGGSLFSPQNQQKVTAEATRRINGGTPVWRTRQIEEEFGNYTPEQMTAKMEELTAKDNLTPYEKEAVSYFAAKTLSREKLSNTSGKYASKVGEIKGEIEMSPETMAVINMYPEAFRIKRNQGVYSYTLIDEDFLKKRGYTPKEIASLKKELNVLSHRVVGMNDAIKKAEDYANKAVMSNFLELEKMSSVTSPEASNYDENYNEYVKKGKALQYDKSGGTEFKLSKGGLQIDNKRALAMVLAERNGQSVPNLPNQKLDAYRMATNEELNLFAYYLGKDLETGGNEAGRYADLLEDEMALRWGRKDSEERTGFLGNLNLAVNTGLEQYAQGIERNFDKKEYYPITPYQASTMYTTEGLRKEGRNVAATAMDLGVTAFDMAPSILLSSITSMALSPVVGKLAAVGTKGATIGAKALSYAPRIAGNLSMGLSARGNAYAQMINQGYSTEQATAYGNMIMASEVALQSVLGGISKLGGISPKVAKAISQVDNALVRLAIQYPVAFTGEATEEGLQAYLEPLFKEIALGYDTGEKVDWEQIAYEALLGGLMGGFFESPEIIVSNGKMYIQDRATGRKININNNISTLIYEAKKDAGSKNYKRATKLENGKKVSNAKAGALLRHMVEDGQISEANATKLVSEGLNGAPLDEAEQAYFYAGARGIGINEAVKLNSDLDVDSDRAIKAWQMGAKLYKGRKADAQNAEAVEKNTERPKEFEKTKEAPAVQNDGNVAETPAVQNAPVKAVKFKGEAYEQAKAYKTEANAKDFEYAYNQGFNRVKPSEDINLEDVAINAAYLAGVSDSRAVVSSRANFEARTPGLDLVDTVSRDIAGTLSDSTRATINNIGKKLGVKIRLTNETNEIAGGNTEHSQNSSYNFKNGVVTINVDEIHIGLKGKVRSTNKLVRFILAHEGTHRLQETSPEAYAEMEKVALSKSNMTLEEYMKKWNISNEAEARGEIVADYFGDLLSTKAEVKALINENRSLWDKILEVIDWLVYKLKGTGIAYNDIAEARELFRQALEEADATVWGAEVREDESGSFGENEVVLSRSTYDEEGRAKLINWLNNSKLEKSERDRIVSQLDFIYDITTKYTDKFTVFGKWSQAEVLKGEDGKPVLSVVKQNGEYKLNLDFSSVCSKRRPLDTIITKMVESGIINDVLIDENGLVKLNQIINKHGLTVACALCYVEGRRYRQEKVAKDFANLYNGLVDRYNENSTDFSKRILAEQPLNDKGGHKETVDYKIAKHLETHPDERKHIDYTDFMSSEGFTKVAKENPELLKLYNSKKGTGGPKAAFADVQYLNEILSKKTFNAKTAFAVGGVRIQSFSDFVPRLVFDYAQMVADLDAKKLPAHAYTKVVDFVKIFGLTGIKINMSLIPKYVKGGVAPGLDANGNYAWDAESFDFDTAIEIQSDEGYSKNCGTIAVGVSYGHIMKLLADDRIKMVIPYHKSGINPIVAKMLEISAYEDYTESQTTKHNDGTALTKEEKKREFNFNEVMHNRGLTAKEAADEYLKWCDKNDYRPKFAEFRGNENYYKLLADFSCYDVNGEYSPQTAVKMNYPDNVDALIGEAIGKDQSNEDAILREADGIIEEFSAWNETRDDGEVWSRSEEAPTFYSHMSNTIDGMKDGKHGANSVIPYLKGKGVKDEEIKWSGIEAFLEGKKSVTKEELQEFAQGSQLQIEETVLEGGTVTLEPQSATMDGESMDLYVMRDGMIYDSLTWNEFNGIWESDSSGYTFDDQDEIFEYYGGGKGGARWGQYKLTGGKNYREITFTMPDSEYTNQAMRVHWGGDAEGILAHARVQDFEVDGQKMLFIEEIQSDWHNEGHKKGYADSNPGEGIEDAPFRDNYHEYVLKRLIRMAAEQGYASIGWTTADIQSARWSDAFAEGYRIEYDQDIPKFLNKYGKKWGAKVGTTEVKAGGEMYFTTDEGGEHLTIDDAINAIVQSFNELTDNNYSAKDVYRKENAGETVVLDKYTDIELGTITIVSKGTTTVWSMPITDAMKESVLYEGQPLYSRSEPEKTFAKGEADFSETRAKANAVLDIEKQIKALTEKMTEENRKEIFPKIYKLYQELDKADKALEKAIANRAETIKKAKASKAPSDPKRWQTEKANRTKGKDFKVKGVSDIISKLEHDFGIPISSGHISERNARGIYKVESEVVRTKDLNNLPTALHEVGHHLTRKFNLTDVSKDIENELIANADASFLDQYKDSEKPGEAVAEFFRNYFQNAEKAEKSYPLFTKYLFSKLDKKTADIVNENADIINNYYVEASKTATSAIKLAEEKSTDFRTVGERFSDKTNLLYQSWYDSNHAIKLFTDEVENRTAYTFATNAAYADSRAYSMVIGDLYGIDGVKVGEGLAKALENINTKKVEEYKEFGEYLICKNGIERLAEGLDVWANPIQNTEEWMSNRIEELESKYPTFMKTSERLYAFQKSFLNEWGVKSGLVSEESAKSWAERWQYYVPFTRKTETVSRFSKKKNEADSTIKKAKGSKRDFQHPIDSIMFNMQKMVSAALTNRVRTEISNQAEIVPGTGYIIEKIPTPMVADNFNVSALMDELNDAFMSNFESRKDIEKGYNILLSTFGEDGKITKYQRGKANGDIITILKNGKPEFYQVHDTLLLESLVDLEPSQVNPFVKAIKTVNALLTWGATGGNLTWNIFSNMPRDDGTLLAYNKKRDALKLIGGIFQAYFNKSKNALGKETNPVYQEFLAMGGGGGSSRMTADKNYMESLRKKMGTVNKRNNPLKALLNAVEFVSDLIEAGPRYSVYKLFRETYNLTPDEAFYMSMDATTNFRRSGKYSKMINGVVPFFNAAMQGTNRFARYFTCSDLATTNPDVYYDKGKRGKAIWARSLTFVTASAIFGILRSLINSRDDEAEEAYTRLSNYVKNNYYVFYIGDIEIGDLKIDVENIPIIGKEKGKFFAIPKPREIATASSFAERMTDFIRNDDKHAFDEFYDYFTDNLTPPVIQGLVQLDLNGAINGFGVIGTASSLNANKDYMGRPIVSQSLEGLPAKEQYDRGTSKIAYWIGQASAAAGINDGEGLSPKQVDYFMSNVFGFLWKHPKALFPMNEGERDLTLGIKTKWIKDPLYSTDVTNRMYNNKDKLSRQSKANPEDFETKAELKDYTYYTDFFTKYNKLTKDEKETKESREIRDKVLDILEAKEDEFESGKYDNVTEELIKIATEIADASAISSAGDVAVDVNGEPYSMTSKEYFDVENYAKDIKDEAISKLIKSEYYNDLSWKEKSDAAEDLKVYGKEMALEKYIPGYVTDDSTAQKIKAVTNNANLSPEDYILYQMALDMVDKPNKSGNLGTYTQEEASAALNVFKNMTKTDITDEALALLWQIQTDGVSYKNPYGYAIRGTNWYRPNGKDQYDKLWMKER